VPNLAAALVDAKRVGGPSNIEVINLQGFLVGKLMMRWSQSTACDPESCHFACYAV